MLQAIQDFIAYIKEWIRDFLFGPPLPPYVPTHEEYEPKFLTVPAYDICDELETQFKNEPKKYEPRDENVYVEPVVKAPSKKTGKKKTKKAPPKKSAPKKPKKR